MWTPLIVELEIALQTLLCLGDRILAGKATIEQVYNEGKDELYQWKKVGDVGQDAGMKKPERTPWTSALSRVDIMADTPIVQGHPAYQAAKQGDLNAAMRLVSDVMSDAQLNRLREKYRNDPRCWQGFRLLRERALMLFRKRWSLD